MSRRNPRVIVIQQPMKRVGDSERPAFDFSAAKTYGEIKVLAPNGKQILTPDLFREFLAEKLLDFDPDSDYIIPAGDYSVIFMVGLIIGRLHGKARILRWVPASAAYQPLYLDITRS